MTTQDHNQIMPETRDVQTGETAAGQLNQLLGKDSPLMRRSATQGKQHAASRGLLNSSLAAGSAQNAMIQSAAPIAQQDAQANFQQGLANQEITNQFQMADKAHAQNIERDKQQRNFVSSQAELDRQARMDEQERAIEANMQELAKRHAYELEQLGYKNELDQKNVSSSFAATTSQKTMESINAILSDPNLDPGARRGAIDNVVKMANETMAWGEKFYNTPMPEIQSPNQQQAPALPYQQYLGRLPF